MIRYMLDTDITSYLMKTNHPLHHKVMKNLQRLAKEQVCISVITVTEIAMGIESAQDDTFRKKLEKYSDELFTILNILDFNEESAWLYGKIRAKLKATGNDIGIMDTLIAAHAMSHHLTLVTNNHNHFHRIPGIKVENWSQP